MKAYIRVVMVALTFASLSFAIDTSSAPAAPAGVVTVNATSAMPAPVMPAHTQSTKVASEGSPMPTCPPHQNCPDNLRLTASEGSPMPTCPPHQICPDNVRLTVTAGSQSIAAYLGKEKG